MHAIFDVGVVGAGVAGSVCARALGEAGINVAVLDHSHPREKPCGGLIENTVVEELRIPNEILENEVKWLIAERFGFRSSLSCEPHLFLVSRKDFDNFLLKQALENKSVTFFPEKVVEVTKDEKRWLLTTSSGRSIRVKKVIGADGCPSTVRKSVSFPIPPQFLATTVGYVYHCSGKYVEETFQRNTIEGFYDRRYVPKGGFLWVFPKRTTINIGVGSIEPGKKLKQALSRFVLQHPTGKKLQTLPREFYTHVVPAVWTERFFDTSSCSNDWALIGDAAAHVNPISGAGIYYAMKDGISCASALLNGDLQLYDRYWRREYGDELLWSAKHVLRFYSNLGLFLWLTHVIDNRMRQLLH